MRPIIHLQEVEGLFCDINPCESGCLTIHQLSESLGNAIDAKDWLTRNHSQQVAVISYLIALALGCSTKQADIIHIAGHLHDIGKIGIPDEVLKKQDRFTETDWKWMRGHPEIGARIVAPVKIFKSNGGISKIILHHHERFDGFGYPAMIRRNDIPIGARIVAVSDALSALIQDRAYRKGKRFEDAVEEIIKHSGTQFDPVIIKVFTEISSDIKQWLEAI